jgi:hypothetical protein
MGARGREVKKETQRGRKGGRGNNCFIELKGSV